MFVRGQDGTWYEVADKSVAGKEIDSARAIQAIAEAKAQTRKKAAEILASLDPDVSNALQGIIADAISAGRLTMTSQRIPQQVGAMTGMEGLECWGADCWGADCWSADCIDWMESPDMGYTRQPMNRPMQRKISRRRY